MIYSPQKSNLKFYLTKPVSVFKSDIGESSGELLSLEPTKPLADDNPRRRRLQSDYGSVDFASTFDGSNRGEGVPAVLLTQRIKRMADWERRRCTLSVRKQDEEPVVYCDLRRRQHNCAEK